MNRILILIAFLVSSIAHAQEVIELPSNSTKVIVKIAFKNGSICDPVGKEGLTNLTSSLLVETGSDQYTKSEINDLLYPMAASYGAFTDKEMTTFTFAVHVDFLEEFYEIFRGVLLNPSFAQSDFERVKSNLEVYVKEVIKASSDEEFSKMALEAQLFDGTRYAHMKQGTASGLTSITREDVVNHYKKFFTSKNVLIGIAGKYDKALVAKIKADVAKLSAENPSIPSIGEVKMPDGINVQLIPKPNNLGTAIFTGYPIDIDRSSPDWPAMLVINSYLGEHRKSYSKLYKLIREQRSMNYGDYTYIEWYEAAGNVQLPLTGFPRSQNYFAIWIRPVQTAISLTGQYPELAGLKIGHAHFAMRMALMEVDRVSKEGLTKEEFDLTKQFLMSYMNLFVQTPAKQLGYLMDSRFYGMKDYISEMNVALAKLTLEEANAAAAKYLQVANMDITMITDNAEAEPLKQSLLTNAPSPMSYSDVVKGSLGPEIFEVDKKAEVFPMNVKSVKIVPPGDLFE
ncbi:MAG: M16 family metallopeptidase [Bacteroidota bacterium]